MGGIVDLTVFLACFSLIFYAYAAAVILLSGILYWLLPFIILSCVFFGLILRYRIPKPKKSATSRILGSEWGSYIINSSEKPSNDYIMKFVGHRACSLDAPENSMSALEKIYKEGVTAVEFDVILTADNVPIVFHDDTLTRMTDVAKAVQETTYDEICSLDISVKHTFGEKYRNERIPTLEEFVNFCIEKEIRMFIDLKADDKSMVKVIINLYKSYPKLYELAVVSSFDVFTIYQIRANDSDIVCSVAWRPYFYSHSEYNGRDGASEPRSNNPFIHGYHRFLNSLHYWLLCNFGYYILGLSAMLLHKDMITRNLIQHWSKRGIRVIAWSVNLPSEKQYFERILEMTYLTDTVINS